MGLIARKTAVDFVQVHIHHFDSWCVTRILLFTYFYPFLLQMTHQVGL